MPVQEILELAHQGNPTAIATLINYITQPRGIKVRVQRQSNDLHILVESEPFPDQQEAVAFIQDTLKELQAQPIQTVTIYGRQQGERIPAWQQTIAWQGHSIQEQPELATLQPEAQLKHIETEHLEIEHLEIEHLETEHLEAATSPEINLQATEVTPSDLAEVEIIEGKVVLSEVASPEVMEPKVVLSTDMETAIVPGSPTDLSPQVLSEPEISVPELSTSLNLNLESQYNAASSAVSLTSRNQAFLEGLLEPLTFIDTSLPLMESSDTPEVLKRPESVFFLFFMTIVTVWEAYLTLLEEDDETKPKKVLSTSQLARRLQTSKRTIRRQKRLEGFSEWTRSLDPDGIAWFYSRGVYLPCAG